MTDHKLNTEDLNSQLKLEIEALKEKIALLKESEERYRLISSVTTDYTFSTKIMPDGTLDLNWVAGAFKSISGYSLDEFKKRGGWRATIHPDDIHIDDNDLARLQNNKDTESQIRTINKNGEVVWMQVFAHPIWNKEKNCLKGIYGAVKNITDSKRTEEKLIKSERHFRELLENVSLIAIILDIQGKVIFCNEYLLNMSGYSSTEMMGADWFDLMIPNGRPEVKELFLKGLKEGEILSRYENPIKTKDGQIREIVWSNALQKDSNGRISGASSIGEDITEQKLAQEEILSKDKLLRLTGQMAKVGGWEFDAKTMNGNWSDEVARIHALDPKDKTNVKIALDFYDKSSRIIIEDAIRKAINQQESYDLILKMTDAVGVEKWVRSIGIPIVENGEVIRLEGTFQDVTKLRNAEEALRKLNEELEQRVMERTEELETKNAELARMNRLFVGRELRMIELKNNIKTLEEIIKSHTK